MKTKSIFFPLECQQIQFNNLLSAISTKAAVGGTPEKVQSSQIYISLFATAMLILIVIVILCLALYYRRRYKRLKQTTNLMVQYRVVTTETPPPLGKCGLFQNCQSLADQHKIIDLCVSLFREISLETMCFSKAPNTMKPYCILI